MNKKSLLTLAIAILTVGAIGAVIYPKDQPKTLTNCEFLLTKMLEAKTEAEHSFAEERWKLICITNEK